VDRSQRTEDRGQMTENREQTSDIRPETLDFSEKTNYKRQDLDIRSSGNQEIRISGDPGIRRYGYQGIWTFEKEKSQYQNLNDQKIEFELWDLGFDACGLFVMCLPAGEAGCLPACRQGRELGIFLLSGQTWLCIKR